MSMTERWVSDRLHDILGMSDKYIAQYMVGLASKATSGADLIEKLKATGTVDVDQNMVTFLHELYTKVPHKAIQEKPARAMERAAIELRKKNESYALLSSEEEEQYTVPAKKPKKEKDKKKKNRQLRKKREESSSESEPEPARPPSRSPSESEDEMDAQERERVQDLKERDELSKRLREKDKNKTRQVMSKTEKKAYEEAKKRLQMETEDRKRIIPELRKKSRYDYLGKRRADKLEDLEMEIQEEEYFFGDQNLSAKEKADIEYKRRVLKLAKEHEQAGEVEKVNRYYMPEDGVKPQDRYVEDRQEKGPNFEQKRWEEEHLHAALHSVGAKDAKQRKKKKVPTATLR